MMYLDYFGLRQHPFSLTPDPSFLFMSHDHQEALAHLLYGVGEMGGFVQLTGEVGTGKTTLCRCMLEQVPKNVDVALILNPKQTSVELVASICDELRIAYSRAESSIKVLVDILNHHLLRRYAQGRRTVLVIDEAQNLSIDVLEQVRLLTNLETTSSKLLQIILIGQPELQVLMNRPELRQLAQRITARYHLDSLTLAETASYIRHRLEIVDCRQQIFTDDAIKLIHRLSKGVPRLINIICDRSLLGAYVRRLRQVNRVLVHQAYQEIHGRTPLRSRRRQLVWSAAALGLVLLVSAGWLLQQKSTPPPALLGSVERSETASTEPIKIEPKAIASPSPEQPQLLGTPVAVTMPALPEPPAAEPSVAAEATEPVNPAPEPTVAYIGKAADTEPPEAQKGPPTPPTKARMPSAEIYLSKVPATTTEAPSPSLEVESKPFWALDLDGMLQGGTRKTDVDTAFKRLFYYWNFSYDNLVEGPACVRAMDVGLRCTQGSGSRSDLLGFNRPAVVELIDSRELYHYAVLVGASDNALTLDLDGQQIHFPLEIVDAHWNGNFTMLWRPPQLSSTILRLGDHGTDVLWLRARLDQLDGIPVGLRQKTPNPSFDNGLKKRVMQFQRKMGLRMDGVVGQLTLMHLNTATGDTTVPVLR